MPAWEMSEDELTLRRDRCVRQIHRAETELARKHFAELWIGYCYALQARLFPQSMAV